MNAPYYAIVAALFFTFLYVTGRVLWPATGKHPLGLPLATALGMGFWICVSFALCATGYYTPTVLRSLFWSGLVLALVWLVIRSRAARATAPAISRNPMRLDLLVVVPQQMEHSVNQQPTHFFIERAVTSTSLAGGRLDPDHHVSQHLRPVLALLAGDQ